MLRVTQFKYNQFCIPACGCFLFVLHCLPAVHFAWRMSVCQKEILSKLIVCRLGWINRTILQRLKIKVIYLKVNLNGRNKIGFSRATRLQLRFNLLPPFLTWQRVSDKFSDCWNTLSGCIGWNSVRITLQRMGTVFAVDFDKFVDYTPHRNVCTDIFLCITNYNEFKWCVHKNHKPQNKYHDPIKNYCVFASFFLLTSEYISYINACLHCKLVYINSVVSKCADEATQVKSAPAHGTTHLRDDFSVCVISNKVAREWNLPSHNMKWQSIFHARKKNISHLAVNNCFISQRRKSRLSPFKLFNVCIHLLLSTTLASMTQQRRTPYIPSSVTGIMHILTN